MVSIVLLNEELKPVERVSIRHRKRKSFKRFRYYFKTWMKSNRERWELLELCRLGMIKKLKLVDFDTKNVNYIALVKEK